MYGLFLPIFNPLALKNAGGDRGDIGKDGHRMSHHFPAIPIQISNSYLFFFVPPRAVIFFHDLTNKTCKNDPI